MTWKSALTALTLTLALASAALAAPTFLGPTGMLLVPTADALAADEASALVYDSEVGSQAAYVFNYGIRENLEVGFTRLPNRETIVNLKYNFRPEDADTVGIALGMLDVTDQVNASLYVVASKELKAEMPGITNLRVHAGIAAGGDNASVVPLDGFFGGLSADIAGTVELMVENDGNDWNFGTGILFGRGLEAKVGVVGDDNDLVYGLSYTSVL